MTFAAARGAIQRPKARARSNMGSPEAATCPVTLDTVPDAMSIAASVRAVGLHMYNVVPVGSTNDVERPSDGGSAVVPARTPCMVRRSNRSIPFVEQTTQNTFSSTAPAASSSHEGGRVAFARSSDFTDDPSNDADQ